MGRTVLIVAGVLAVAATAIVTAASATVDGGFLIRLEFVATIVFLISYALALLIPAGVTLALVPLGAKTSRLVARLTPSADNPADLIVRRGALAQGPAPGRTERDVLRLLAEGLQNAQIAERLVLAPKTVPNNVSPILAKLNVADRTEAAIRAREAGLRGGRTR